VVSWLFLIAYTCSGLAGLVYEVTWTRLLTLYIGHTTAAASAVVAAFLGGLALGAGAGGRVAARLTPRRCLKIYAMLEVAVVVCAVLLPIELRMFQPVLQSAYADGTGALFPLIRILSCIVMVMVPALALGATFPMAVRWFSRHSSEPASESGALYFLNTVGAAVGAMVAGFVLIPSVGMSRTIYFAIAATTLAALSVLVVLNISRDADEPLPQITARPAEPRHSFISPWIAIAILGLSGFAALVHEIAWTRILSLILGPTTYAFAATLTAVVAGVAVGSGAGTWLVSTRASKAAGMLAFTLSLAAVTAGWTYSIAGTRLPMIVARYVADDADFDQLLIRGVLLTMALIVPTSACLGAAFPLALSLADDRAHPAARRFGLVYAINTIGSVAGSLAAGFLFIPALGIQPTLWIVSGCLIAGAVVLIFSGALSGVSRAAGFSVAVISIILVATSPPWDRELLASGVYMYAPYVPKDLDLETQLKAGELLYYDEGASATVSVKKLTGTTTLAVDGKTDASNRGDRLTQKLIAHLPLLLHKDPKRVFVIGLGSGMTAGAALTHAVERVDVIEISPEVVEASEFFKTENGNALADPRTHLLIGDGRSHLSLSTQQYDVIVSEPSNPWIAGVSSLFTREFFASARDRLAPGGVICQWVNAYNISAEDLKSVIATFTAVFPEGTVWLVGRDDVLLLATLDSIGPALERLPERMARPEAAADLRSLGILDPFSIRSLQVGDSQALGTFTAGSRIFTDDQLTLEFTAPRELHNRRAGENGAALRALRAADSIQGSAAEWRNRAAMMAKADHFELALQDYHRALQLDPSDAATIDGLVKAALITHKAKDALGWIEAMEADTPNLPSLVAGSKLAAADGNRELAIEMATAAAEQGPLGLAQLASVYADSADTVRLDETVARLRATAPEQAPTIYYSAVAAFLHGNAVEAANLAERAIERDPNYAPTYDLAGAAYTKLGKIAEARAAFLKSLAFDAHDSTAYENLGVLELNAGNRAAAVKYFSEALWLVPDSQTARQGLAQSQR
jgi:spermidine synthase